MLTTLLLASAVLLVAGQQPRTIVEYTITVDSAHRDVIRVRLHVEHAPTSLRLAMKVHPEYDARFWRFLDSITVRGTTDDRDARVTRIDSTLWQVTLPGGRGEIGYVVRLPPEPQPLRNAWRCVVRDDGALLNPPDVLLYLADRTDAPATIELRIPKSWSIATSLPRAPTGTILRAPDATAMLDAPILLGHIRLWQFRVANARFYVDYWPLPNASPFDTTRLVDGIQRLTRAAVAIFGGLPSPSFHFLLQDGAGDALEHRASVTIGLPSTELARNPQARIEEIAHEFFHTWNLVAVHPDHYGDLSYTRAPPTSGLWFGEGVTLHYADVLVRRAGLADSTFGSRDAHLADLLARYYAAAWLGRVSPEAASLSFGATMLTSPNATGSYYLQGELLGEALDAAIRDSTRDRHTLDDLLRALYARSASGRGFTSSELVAIADSLCRCRLDGLFARSVRGPAPIDLSPAVRRLGWRIVVDTVPAADNEGALLADTRLSGAAVDSSLALIVNPNTQWAEIGIRTGDRLDDLNGARPRTFLDLYLTLRRLHIGDSLTIDVRRAGEPLRFATLMRGYDRPRVRLADAYSVTQIERARRARWLDGW